MQNFCKIQCDISSTNPAANLQLEVWIDQYKILDSQITETKHIEYRITDNSNEHELKFVLKNKSTVDTVIDQQGNIIQDSVIKIQNIKFDNTELGYLFTQLSTYTHNNNGHSATTTQQFFGEMGCNGTVSLRFTTPIYLWLLEHM